MRILLVEDERSAARMTAKGLREHGHAVDVVGDGASAVQQATTVTYDIVVNGREMGSGSIRITDPDIQRRVFAAIGIDAEDAQRKFGFLLEAFEYGVPPHGGWGSSMPD